MLNFDIVLFTNLFVHVTCILIMWGVYASYQLYSIIQFAYKYRGKYSIRESEKHHLVSILSVTVLLTVVLFLFPSFFSYHIFSVALIEIWYSCFVIYYTTTVLSKTAQSLNNSILLTR